MTLYASADADPLDGLLPRQASYKAARLAFAGPTPPQKFNVRKVIPGASPTPILARSPPLEGVAGTGSGSAGGERRLNSACISFSENRFALFGLMQSAA
jgi:hypothetical protein